MRHSARMTCDFLKLNEGDTALLCLPVAYISGKMMIIRAIERKLKLSVVTPSSRPLKELTQAVDFCAMSPLQVENSLDRLHLLQKLIIGGAQVPQQLQRKIHDTLSPSTKVKIYETYGMSETLSHIALKEIFPVRENHFKAFEGIGLSTDGRNCLKIDAPQMNADTLQTNDIVELNDDGTFVFIGRQDNVINSGGLKIHPEVLEDFAKQHLAYEVVFTAQPDEMLGEKLVMAIEAEENPALKEEIDDLNTKIAKKHSRNHVPKEIYFFKTFPRLANGKINRRDITQLVQDRT